MEVLEKENSRLNKIFLDFNSLETNKSDEYDKIKYNQKICNNVTIENENKYNDKSIEELESA